jgi:predicted TIM-barrel fold metal-dependent hydrolase
MEPALQRPREGAPSLIAASTPREVIAALDRYNIDKACMFAPRVPGQDAYDLNYSRGNRAVAEVVSAYPDRVIGFARIYVNGYVDSTNEIIRCRDEYGFRGLMLHGDWDFVPIGTSAADPYLMMCQAWGWPVFYHAGTYPACEPGLLIPVAERFPKLNLIAGHLGYDMIDDAITAAVVCPNIYLETSANATATAIQEVVKRCGPGKLIYGSGLPYAYPDHILDKIRQLPSLSGPDQEAILGGTMLKLLGLN